MMLYAWCGNGAAESTTIFQAIPLSFSNHIDIVCN